MRRAVAAFALLALACGPETKPPSSQAAAPAAKPPPPVAEQPPLPEKKIETLDPLSKPPGSSARPGVMVAEITVPDIDGLSGALRGYAAQTGAPGFTSWDPAIRTLVRELAGTRQLELDWSKPLAAFVFPDGTSTPRTVLASYADKKPENVSSPKRVHRQGEVWLIGDEANIDAVRGYATTLAIKPGGAELAIYPGPTWTAYEQLYRGLMSISSTATPERELLEELIGVFRNSERLVIGLEAHSSSAELTLELEPRADTGVARFGGAQKPADHALLGYLPGGNWSAVASGAVHIDKAVAAKFAQLSTAAATTDETLDFDMLARQLWDQMAVRAGGFAWAGNLAKGGSEIVELIELRDSNGAEALIDGFAAATKAEWDRSVELMRRAQRDRRVRGVKVKALTVERVKAKRPRPWWFRYGTVDGYVFGASGKSSNRNVGKLIAGARRAAAKKPPLPSKIPSGLTAALVGSKQRRENMMIWLDLAALGAYMGKPVPAAAARKGRASGVIIGLRMTASSLAMRITVPADQIGVVAQIP